jgi:hypothetical protein
MMYRLTSWLDDRWSGLHARMTQDGRWGDPDRHPVVFYIGTVPLSTWLAHPRDGVDSVRRHVAAWRELHADQRPQGGQR